MKTYLACLILLFAPLSVLADEEPIPSISSSCVIQSSESTPNSLKVEYRWNVTAKANEKRILSAAHVRRSVLKNLGEEPWILGWDKALWCDPESTQEKTITLRVDRRAGIYEFDGFMVKAREESQLPANATVSISTHEVDRDDQTGQLIHINIADKPGKEISQHFIFIRYAAPQEYAEFSKEADVDNSKQWKTFEWQRFMDPQEVKDLFHRALKLVQEGRGDNAESSE